jgi:hypothetical protein
MRDRHLPPCRLDRLEALSWSKGWRAVPPPPGRELIGALINPSGFDAIRSCRAARAFGLPGDRPVSSARSAIVLARASCLWGDASCVAAEASCGLGRAAGGLAWAFVTSGEAACDRADPADAIAEASCDGVTRLLSRARRLRRTRAGLRVSGCDATWLAPHRTSRCAHLLAKRPGRSLPGGVRMHADARTGRWPVRTILAGCALRIARVRAAYRRSRHTVWCGARTMRCLAHTRTMACAQRVMPRAHPCDGSREPCHSGAVRRGSNELSTIARGRLAP